MKTKILVVDDEGDMKLLLKQRFRRKIRENTYEFVFSPDGQAALHFLQQHPDIDVVLSDINMPIMDGLTLLSKLPEVSPVIRAVMVSAYGDMANIRAAMNRGAFDFVCKPFDIADLEVTIDKTAQYVRQLRETLRAVEENAILKMYVDTAVLDLFTRAGANSSLLVSETVSVSVVFIDLCGFTALAEKLAPTALVQLLNTYFDQMVQEISGQSGYVDKFMGDTIMAVFRGEYHLDRALDAALAVRARLQAKADALPDGSTYQPNVAIGISTGEVVLGNIGSSSLRRFDYTVIGDVVNLGQRLQSVAQPGQILITEAAYQQIHESFQCQPLQKAKVKNKVNPVMMYEVVA